MSVKSGVSQQTISLPKGGGAIKGIGETFQPNLFSGTGNFTIPIATSPGRNDFDPKLSLQYSTGNGNGPFGLGWQLSIPRITRKTEKGLPRYTDEDVFVMSGAEDLVPIIDKEKGSPVPAKTGNYVITRYRPRTEGLFARIEKWERNDGDVHWRAITKENIASIYGKDDNARIVDPDDTTHIYEWLLQETFDAKGNHILYEYVKENPDLKIDEIYEVNRKYTQTYIRRILYGNVPDGLDNSKKVRPERTGTDHQQWDKPKERSYLFEVLFDYGDIPPLPSKSFIPSQLPEEKIPVNLPPRDDPFSSFRSGFEIRTLRRCQRVLMLHYFDEREMKDAPLVKSTDFEYANDKNTKISLLLSAKVKGYKKKGETYLSADMPPVSFIYSEFKPQTQRYEPITARGGDMPPVALNNPNISFFDIYGNGLPDVLQTSENGYYYWENLGEGKLDMRRLQQTMPAGVVLSNHNVMIGDMGGDGLADLIVEAPNMSGFFEATADGKWKPFKRFNSIPSFHLSDPNVRLVDLTGDGLSDVLITQDNYFIWFQCLGEEGYGEPQFTPREHDLDMFPDVYFNDPSGRVRLADITGDGLNDIVLIHKGRIDYWPNLGYGHFGKRVTMADSPKFDSNFDPRRLFFVDIDGSGCSDLVYVDDKGVHFWFNQSGNGWSEEQTIPGTPDINDATSIQFADFFGTGTTSIIFIYDHFSQPGGNYKALDFCGGVKPYLLCEMSNNMGATTKVKYASSTRFYLEDKKNGKPWVTNLPFPVQVVEKTEVIDHISKTKLVTTYKYHHGYFDGREREFRGFGCVEQFDTEEFETFAGSSLHEGDDLFENNEKAYNVPPVCTKTWFHTGVYFDENLPSSNGSFYDKEDMMAAYREEFYHGDGKAFKLDDNKIALTEAPHEAYRALRGSVLRTEVYAIDGTGKEEHPYMVTESRYEVKTPLQDAKSQDGRNYHGVFLPFQRETVSYHYERNPSDPRIVHKLTLNVDDYGNVTDSVSIAYPRRIPTSYDEQQKIKATYTNNRFINKDQISYDSKESGFYFIGTPCETRVFEVHGLNRKWKPDAGGLYKSLNASDFDTIKGPDGFEPYTYNPDADPASIKKRIIDWKRTYFRKDENPGILDPIGSTPNRLDSGEINSSGLPYESYQAAFTTEMLGKIYRKRLDTKVLSKEGGYHDEDGYWWIPSGRQSFDENKFFQIKQTQDPFKQVTTIEYDSYGLLMESVTDPFGNETSAINDYRVLQPKKVNDPNETSNEVAFDALCMVVGTAVMGTDTDGNPVGDSLEGFVADIDDSDIKAHINDPLTKPHAILGKATTRLVYDLKRFQNKRQSNVVYTMARETHVSDEKDELTKVQHSFVYSDGFGREVQTKVQAESDPLIKDNPLPRWTGTGTTIFNNKGKPVQKFEPFFCDTHTYGIEKHGVSPIIFYDPLERIVCTLHPNHTYEKVVFDPWRQETWDTNDTIHPSSRFDPEKSGIPDPRFNPADDPDTRQYFRELSPDMYLPTWYNLRMDPNKAAAKWSDVDPAGFEIKGNDYKRKAEKSAAEKAAKHATTPSVAHLDVLGRVFLTIADNGKDKSGNDEFIKTHVMLDIEGNDLVITDPREIEAFKHVFDIAGRKLCIESVDAGKRVIFPNAAGNPVYSWDAEDHQVHTLYDKLQRPMQVSAKKGQNREKATERIVYGEEIQNKQAAKNKNLIGKIYQQFDSSGAVINSGFDFKGNLTESSRYLSREYKYENVPDWKQIPPIPYPSQPIKITDGRLETEKFTVTTQYDALNRVMERIDPDRSHHFYTYNEAKLLETVSCHIKGENDSRQFVTNINYNARGQREKIEYGNNTTTSYEYDPETFRLEKIVSLKSSGRALQDLTYTYDPAGNITQIQDAAFKTIFNGNGRIDPVSRYKYDPIYRLTRARGREHQAMTACHYQLGDKKNTEFIPLTGQPINNGKALRNYCEDYEYDKSGNIRKIKHSTPPSRDCPDSGWTRDQEYSKTSNRIEYSKAGCPYENDFISHDENGNILNAAHLRTMSWDHANRLVQVDIRTSENGSVKRAHYVYDASGQRVRKVIMQNSKRAEERIYLGGYEIYRKYNCTGITFERTTTHIMDDKKRIALVEQRIQPETEETEEGETDPCTRIRYQLDNHLGSSMLEIDETEKCISYEEYLPYGGTAFMAGNSWTEVKCKRYRYSGKERDDETGLYYYGARYYASWLGRWMSCDPAGMADGLNSFQYSKSSPIRFFDLNGKESFDDPSLVTTNVPESGRGVSIDYSTLIKADDKKLIESISSQDFLEQMYTDAQSENPLAAELFNRVITDIAIYGRQNSTGLFRSVVLSRKGKNQLDDFKKAFGEGSGGKLLYQAYEYGMMYGLMNPQKEWVDYLGDFLSDMAFSRPGANKPKPQMSGGPKQGVVAVSPATPVNESFIIEGSGSAPTVIPSHSTVSLPNPGENQMGYGTRVHQDFERIINETNPGAGGRFNVAPGLTGPDLANPTGMNATFAEMKSLWGKQRSMVSQAQNWGFDAQTGRYFFYDRRTGLVFEGIIQTEKYSSGRFKP